MEVTPEFIALTTALAAAQGAFDPIPKNRNVKIVGKTKNGDPTSYQFRYADLETIIACTRPALAKNGLSVVQVLDDTSVTTLLLHAGGGSIKSVLFLPSLKDFGDPKQYGGHVAYLRRYAYSSLLCVAADDDLDENGRGAGDNEAEDKVKEPSPDLLAHAETAAGQGEKAYAAFWSGLTGEERNAIGSRHLALKKKAASVKASAVATEGA